MCWASVHSLHFSRCFLIYHFVGSGDVSHVEISNNKKNALTIRERNANWRLVSRYANAERLLSGIWHMSIKKNYDIIKFVGAYTRLIKCFALGLRSEERYLQYLRKRVSISFMVTNTFWSKLQNFQCRSNIGKGTFKVGGFSFNICHKGGTNVSQFMSIKFLLPSNIRNRPTAVRNMKTIKMNA